MSSQQHNTHLPKQSDVIVIGGGISGLTTAWYLARKGKQVVLLEKNSYAGGKISTTTEQGYTTEASASMLMNFRSEIDQFLIDSKIIQQKELRNSKLKNKRAMIKDGKLKQVPSSIYKMITSPLWSITTKFRLLTEWMIPVSKKEDESVEQFITRRFGKQFLEQAIEPFVAATLACDVKQASADAVLPRLKILEKEHGSITAGIIANKIKRKRTAENPEVFSFDGGMQTLITKLASEKNFKIAYDCKVKQIKKKPMGWEVALETNRHSSNILQSTQIVLAVPAYVAAKLLEHIDTKLAQLLASIKYAPMNLIHLGYNKKDVPHDLEGIGFLTPESEKSNLLGNLWMSSVFKQRAPKGKVLLTSYLGGSRLTQVSEWSDQDCVSEVQKNLKHYLNISATPDMIRIDRHKSALPLYHGNYFAKTKTIKRRLNNHHGLFINANYLDGVSVRDRIYQAHKTSVSMLAQSKREKKGCQLPKTKVPETLAVESSINLLPSRGK